MCTCLFDKEKIIFDNFEVWLFSKLENFMVMFWVKHITSHNFWVMLNVFWGYVNRMTSLYNLLLPQFLSNQSDFAQLMLTF